MYRVVLPVSSLLLLSLPSRHIIPRTAATMSNGIANGSHRTLKSGVWAPIPTFFDAQENIGE